MSANQAVQYQIQTANVDATSYIYFHTKEPVPLANYFLNFKYLNSEQEALISGESNKISTSLSSEKSAKNAPISFQYSDAILLVLIALFSLIAFVKISGKNYLSRIFTSVSNYSYSNSFFKEKNLAYTLNNNILLFVFYISSAMYAGLIVDYFGLPVFIANRWLQMLFYLAIILSGIIIYKLTYRVFGLLIGNYRITAEFLFFFSNLLKVLGLVYVFLLFASHFSSGSIKTTFLYAAILATLITFFIKLYRIFVIFLRNRFPLYYMILYFCALEIIPVVLIIKLLWLISRENFTFFNILT